MKLSMKEFQQITIGMENLYEQLLESKTTNTKLEIKKIELEETLVSIKDKHAELTASYEEIAEKLEEKERWIGYIAKDMEQANAEVERLQALLEVNGINY